MIQSLRQFLPSARIVIPTLIAVVLVGGVMVLQAKLAGRETPAPVIDIPLQPTPRTTLTRETTRDTDDDGLKDWEERLWGTLSDTADTDGDGTLDGQEITDGRDPTRPGPDDLRRETFVQEDPERTTPVSTTTPENLNPTEQFSYDLFSGYVGIKSAGGTVGPAEAQLFAQGFLSGITPETPQVFQPQDVLITPHEDVITLKQYGDALGAAFLLNNKDVRNELALLVAHQTNPNDEGILREFKDLALGYSGFGQSLLGIPVPQTAAPAHLILLNNLVALTHDIDGFTTLGKADAVTTIALLKSYELHSDRVSTAFADIKKVLAAAGVVFAPEDPGYILTGGV